MAVEKDFVSTTGQMFTRVYFNIFEYSCDSNNVVRARIRGYVTKDLAESGASSIEGSEIIVELAADYSDNSMNTKQQIYKSLKWLPEFEDAVDVI